MTAQSEQSSDAPITEALIARVMAGHPGVYKSAQAAYYEAVHQELAPLCRQFEVENARLKADMQAMWSSRRAPDASAQADAENFRWLAERFTGFDMDWGGDPDVDEPGKYVLVFNAPDDFRVSADIGKSINEYRLATQDSGKEEMAEPARQVPDTLRDAVANLIKVKGRHHTEQAYQRLVDTYDALLAQETK